jgi:hypothetical protein
MYLPVYLDSQGKVMDNSTNFISIIDSSYNFTLAAVQMSASDLSNLLTYKTNNGNYTFQYNYSQKVYINNSMKSDLENVNLSLDSDNFVSSNNTSNTPLHDMYLQYIADILTGHPLGQAMIKNDFSIITEVKNCKLYEQFTNVLTNGLFTSNYQSNIIAETVVEQLQNEVSSRFDNRVDDTEYSIPFQSGDKISIFVKMRTKVNLEGTPLNQFSILSSMYQNNPYIEFVNTNMKIKESKWRIVITLA